jgi:hypothetical protein
MSLSETMHSYTQEEETKTILNPPEKLSPHHPVETPFGTWIKDGDVAIFESNVFGLEQHTKHNIPKVKDINSFTSSILEKEIEVNQAEKTKPAARKPLSIKRIAASIATLGF